MWSHELDGQGTENWQLHKVASADVRSPLSRKSRRGYKDIRHDKYLRLTNLAWTKHFLVSSEVSEM